MSETSISRYRDLLALSLIPGLGKQRARRLLDRFGDAKTILRLSKSELRRIDGIGEASALAILTFSGWELVDHILTNTERTGASLMGYTDSNYPAILKQIYDPPLLLWYRGDVELMHQPGVAVIGTRNPSTYGRKTGAELSRQLVSEGLMVVSGLARGIDALAHQTALDEKGATIGVLGSGIDWLYPPENKKIALRMLKERGLILTEYPPGSKPDAGNFPERNRIVSGLSLGVCVVESGLEGGSMITADVALEQNREVFAIPHRMEDIRGSGCNYLIKTGAAKLVQHVNDILDELPVEGNGERGGSGSTVIEKRPDWRTLSLGEPESRICEQLEKNDAQLDDLANKLGLSTGMLLSHLLDLEMKQLVVQKAGKHFSLK